MQNIVDYRVLSFSEARKLESTVMKYIKDGWVPLGGLAFTAVGESKWQIGQKQYLQAIVKYEEEKDDK